MNFLEWFNRVGSPDLLSVTISLLVTFLLSVAIAWIHRKTYRGTAYTQDYAHTLVIVAVVTSVLVITIGSKASIGVAMFAAFSMIRFPSSFRQSSDLAFGLLAIAVGMVAGTGRHGTAVMIAALVGAVVMVLHYRNAFAPARATHQLSVSLDSDADFEQILAPVFLAHTEENRLLRIIPSDDGSRSEVRYGLQLKTGTSMPVFIEALHDACGNRRVVLMPVGQEFDMVR